MSTDEAALLGSWEIVAVNGQALEIDPTIATKGFLNFESGDIGPSLRLLRNSCTDFAGRISVADGTLQVQDEWPIRSVGCPPAAPVPVLTDIGESLLGDGLKYDLQGDALKVVLSDATLLDLLRIG